MAFSGAEGRAEATVLEALLDQRPERQGTLLGCPFRDNVERPRHRCEDATRRPTRLVEAVLDDLNQDALRLPAEVAKCILDAGDIYFGRRFLVTHVVISSCRKVI